MRSRRIRFIDIQLDNKSRKELLDTITWKNEDAEAVIKHKKNGIIMALVARRYKAWYDEDWKYTIIKKSCITNAEVSKAVKGALLEFSPLKKLGKLNSFAGA